MAGRTWEQGDQVYEPEGLRLPPLPIASAVFLGLLVTLLLLPLGWGWLPKPGPPPIAGLANLVDEAGWGVLGKVAASLLCAVAVSFFYLAAASRRSLSEARLLALVLALGTGIWAAGLTLGPQAAALALVSAGVFCVARSEDDPRWGDRAALPLGLAAAVQPADIVLVVVIALGLVIRRPRRAPWLVLWAAPGGALFLHQQQYLRFQSADHLTRLLSPVDGLLLAPIVLVAAAGMVSAWRWGERLIPVTFAAALVAHWLFVGFVAGAGLIEALPLLMLFLAEGMDALRGLAAPVALLSVLIQVVLALTDGRRWERVSGGERWDLNRSPLALFVRERALLPGIPAVADGKVFARVYPVVLSLTEGSRVVFGDEAPSVTGAEPLLRHVRATEGARFEAGRLRLLAPGDGLFLRIGPRARARRFELRIVGKGSGTLVVTESTFWTKTPRSASHAAAGAFRIRHPYFYPESGGSDVTISLGSGGPVELESVTLAGPEDPWDPIRLDGKS